MIKTISAIFLLIIVSFTSPAYAQNKPAPTPDAPACGDLNTRFEVNTAPAQHPAQPEAGKALMYFIQDDSLNAAKPRPTIRLGVDGQWVGATQHDSYFYLLVDPGVHHLCASWQAARLSRPKTAAAHFTAEAGGVYYFEAKDIFVPDKMDMIFTPIDSDQGALVLHNLEFSTSHPKK